MFVEDLTRLPFDAAVCPAGESRKVIVSAFDPGMTKRFAAAITAVSLGMASMPGAATANATPADDQFLTIVEELKISFSSPQEAIEVGQAICGSIVSNQHESVEARATVVGWLMEAGLDNSQAAHLMWAAVDVYCPQYNDVVGD